MKFFKTIKFKLTFWYSLLLIIICAIFIFGVNIIVTQYYQRDPIERFRLPLPPRRPMMVEKWEKFSEKQKEAIREIRQEDLRKIRFISLYSFIPLTLLSFAGGYFISEQMLKPIKKLNTATNAISAKNLKKQIGHDDSGDEFSELIENFNKMIKRLNISFKSQKQFTEDASHELKTPLTIIKTNLDSALRDNKITKDEMIKLMKTSLRSVEFMDSLIEDLLLLSLIEEQVPKEKVDILQIVSESVKELKPFATQKNIKIQFSDRTGKNSTIFTGNATLIKRAVMNLVENAIKYSKQNSKIEIKLEPDSKQIVISIKDQGIGIEKSEQDEIFKRFYRVDKSRSRKTGGSGLGLAIVKKIVDIHNGEIIVKSKKNHGSIFTIKLPNNN